MPATTRTMAKRSCPGQGPSSSESFDESPDSSDRGRGHGAIGALCNEGNDNPLLNDVVLAALFKYVTGKDLKSCRLVCKKWNLRTLTFARSLLQVNISAERGGVKNFVKLMESNTLGFPKFENFILRPFDTTEGFGQQFLQLCGQSAKDFGLFCQYAGSYHDRIEDISELFRSAPNLVSFTTTRMTVPKTDVVVKLFPESEDRRKPKLSFLKTMNLSDGWTRDTMKICPTFYEELFEAAENLSTLTLRNFNYTHSDSRLDILNAIEKVGRDATIENLKLDHVTSDDFDILHKMTLKPNGLKLKQFAFQNREGQIDWCQLVSFFMDTLVVLRVASTPGTPTPNFIPHMPKLKFLYIHMTEYTQLNCVNFKKSFPALENVDLSFCYSRQFDDLLTEDERIETLKSSIQCSFSMKMDILNRIGHLFPNLSTLKCRVTPKNGIQVIQYIFTNMIQLEKLSVHGTLPTSSNLDSLLTGFSIRHIKKLRERKGFFVSLENQNIEDRKERILMEVNKYDEKVSVRNLTNLSYLDVQLTGNPDQDSLTDLAGYFGLYLLNSLRHVRVTNCEFSKSCAEILVKDVGLMSWKFQHPKTWNEIIPSVWKQNDEWNNFPIQL